MSQNPRSFPADFDQSRIIGIIEAEKARRDALPGGAKNPTIPERAAALGVFVMKLNRLLPLHSKHPIMLDLVDTLELTVDMMMFHDLHNNPEGVALFKATQSAMQADINDLTASSGEDKH